VLATTLYRLLEFTYLALLDERKALIWDNDMLEFAVLLACVFCKEFRRQKLHGIDD